MFLCLEHDRQEIRTQICIIIYRDEDLPLILAIGLQHMAPIEGVITIYTHTQR